jgi:hypothetical protein
MKAKAGPTVEPAEAVWPPELAAFRALDWPFPLDQWPNPTAAERRAFKKAGGPRWLWQRARLAHARVNGWDFDFDPGLACNCRPGVNTPDHHHGRGTWRVPDG